MPPEKLRLFAFATFLIALAPGPNMLLVMASSVKRGILRSTATMAGCLTAVISMMAISALGVGALLEASPRVFWVLKSAGAAYLAFLGAQMWRGAGAEDREGATPVAMGPKELYRQGFFVAASNPKALLFAAAFLPQFIDPARPKGTQFAWLLAVFIVIETTCYFTYAVGGKGLAATLRRPNVRSFFDRVTGTAFVAFAAAMLFEFR